ncbi:antimicrobial peptide microplusin-like [Dermacentor andersoni]|uniref:antimicrobial peptide microplusin-like n=1 Tax=Dermacentor andersoni TaxID=34620 RepID=UPI0021556AE0|nr:antimicrobial peptide microplusin-like [Dermacentor andersoni]
MKAFLVCAVLATVTAVSFAHHLELCEKDDEQLKSELECIRGMLSEAAKQSFDNAMTALGCADWSCVIRKLCEGGDLEGAMAQYFTQAQITEIHNAATACDPDA